jgi:hypothetical protein
VFEHFWVSRGNTFRGAPKRLNFKDDQERQLPFCPTGKGLLPLYLTGVV